MILYEDGEQFNVPSKWLEEHDKQMRDEVVDEFTEKLEKAIKDDINDEIISMFDGGTVMGAVKFIAEQMKGEQNE